MAIGSRPGSAHPVEVDETGAVVATAPDNRRSELVSGLRFVVVNGSIAACGYLLLRFLVGRGIPAGTSNAIQATLTLQVNFLAGLLFTWRWRAATGWDAIWRRWLTFHMGRGSIVLVNLATFPMIARSLGVSAAFVLLLLLCALAHYALDRWWVFRTAVARIAS